MDSCLSHPILGVTEGKRWAYWRLGERQEVLLYVSVLTKTERFMLKHLTCCTCRGPGVLGSVSRI